MFHHVGAGTKKVEFKINVRPFQLLLVYVTEIFKINL